MENQHERVFYYNKFSILREEYPGKANINGNIISVPDTKYLDTLTLEELKLYR